MFRSIRGGTGESCNNRGYLCLDPGAVGLGKVVIILCYGRGGMVVVSGSWFGVRYGLLCIDNKTQYFFWRYVFGA